MNKGEINKKFLASLGNTEWFTKEHILQNIADNYGISTKQAYDEITNEQAEYLFEYMQGEYACIVYWRMKDCCVFN